MLLVVGAAGACGGETTSEVVPDAAPRQIVAESKELLVGEIAEAILAGGPGDVALLSFTAPIAKLDWNIHGHADGSAQTVIEEFEVMTVHYTFSPTAQADWYLLLRNKNPAPMMVDVRIELFGNLQWNGWQ